MTKVQPRHTVYIPNALAFVWGGGGEGDLNSFLYYIYLLYYYVVIKFVAVVPPSPVTHDAKKWKTIPLLSLPWDFRDANIILGIIF